MDLRAHENLFGGSEKWERIQLRVQQTAVQPAGTKVLLDTGTIRVRYRGTYVKIPVLYIRVLSGVLARSTLVYSSTLRLATMVVPYQLYYRPRGDD